MLVWVFLFNYSLWYFLSHENRQYFKEKLMAFSRLNNIVNYKLEHFLTRIFHLPDVDVKASRLIKAGIFLIAFPEPFLSDFVGCCLIFTAFLWIKRKRLRQIFSLKVDAVSV
ncbi:MAG: hypothetical protein N3F10_05270 [Candidatus Bathyarchaeota archaeon]|nr:hypothetical protein [Candidatus Bathyarchaeota archaeon]MCX8177689.1 hypothetical protein [Candidatus Bathyarchaeota archaeon]MDW8193949.1 hypothetical protein [Nitrososphaerota archaeon]